MSAWSVNMAKSTNNFTGRGAAKATRTLFANLAFKWFDQIADGTKRVEYRALSDYWMHLIGYPTPDPTITRITFARGYTSRRMTFAVEKITIDEIDGCYEIHFGKRVDDGEE